MGLAPFRPHLNPKHGSCSATGTNLKQGTNHLPVLNQLARLIQNFTKLTVTFQSLSSGQNRAGLRVVKASACLTGDFRCSRENAHRRVLRWSVQPPWSFQLMVRPVARPATVAIQAHCQASGQTSHRGHSSLWSGQLPGQPPWRPGMISLATVAACLSRAAPCLLLLGVPALAAVLEPRPGLVLAAAVPHG